MMEHDVQITLIKITEDHYELRTNLGACILSTLNRDQLNHMIALIVTMRDNPPDFTRFYHFPTTAKAVTS